MPLIRLTNTSKDRETRLERRQSAVHPATRLKLNNIFLRPGHSVDLPISVLLPQLPNLTEHEKGKRIRLTDVESGAELSIAQLLEQYAEKPAIIPEEVLADALSSEDAEEDVDVKLDGADLGLAEHDAKEVSVPEALAEEAEEVLPPLETAPLEAEAPPPVKEDLASLLGKKQAELADMCRARGLPVRATDNKTSLAKRLLGQES